MISDILIKSVQNALDKLQIEADSILFEHPSDLSHGDYSTNVALILAKRSGKNPKDLAEEIVKYIEKPKEVEKIEVAGVGFINFYLTKEFFVESLKEASNKDFGKSHFNKGKKIILEYTDPNPFKIFHIGHLMTNTIGESLSRLAEFSGAEVKRVNYQGDVGLHIAKAVWGIENLGKEIKTEKDLGEAYAYGAKKFEDNLDIQSEIIEINKKIYSKSDEEINRLYEYGKEISLKAFEEMYQKLDTKFDHYFFESEVVDEGKRIIKENINLFQKSDGAIVFKGENYGLHTRVFINSDGLPTYEAKELGLARTKYDYFPYDESYVITANEINAYFDVLLEVMKYVYEREGFSEKTTHIGHGMLRLPEGKMSSRTGDVLSAESLISSTQKAILDLMTEREIDQKENTALIIAISALKYSILKQSIGHDIIFDLKKSISFEGDSGPYLQYTAVRANSVLEIAKNKGLKKDGTPPVDWKIGEIEKMIYRFPEITERAWTLKSPQIITKFLIDLAGSFNSFYATEKIALEGEEYKLLLTESVLNVLRNGLYLLGIKVPVKM